MSDSVTTPTEPRTDRTKDEYGRDTRFQIDRRRRWMVSEYHPDAGDGCPSTEFRDPTDEEWAALASRPEPDVTEALRRLHDAYFAIPAGEPTTEQVMERLPDLYAAIQDVLDQSGKIAGLLFVVADAERRGVTVHVATEATCAEHDRVEGATAALAAVPAPSPAPAVSCTVHNLNPCPICAKSVYFGTDAPAAEPSTEGYQLPTTPTGLWLSNLAPELWKQAPRGELMEPMQIPIRRAILAIEAEARAASPSPAVTEALRDLADAVLTCQSGHALEAMAHDAKRLLAAVPASSPAPYICPDCHEPITDIAHWHEPAPASPASPTPAVAPLDPEDLAQAMSATGYDGHPDDIVRWAEQIIAELKRAAYAEASEQAASPGEGEPA